MNKRIRELADQQGLSGPNFLISFNELEKFAELIVRECASKVVRNEALNILEHFGVEE